jgi:hypothetical protein
MQGAVVFILKKKPLQVYYLDAAVKSENPSPPATSQRGPDGTTQFGEQQPCNTRKGVTKAVVFIVQQHQPFVQDQFLVKFNPGMSKLGDRSCFQL